LVNLLALDTSSLRAAIAIGTATGAVHGASPDPAQRHGRNLIPAIHDLLSEAGLTPRDLGGIAVGIGPGSYTGLRIGVTAAKTLAYALGTPLVSLDSLEILARNAPEDALRVAVIADAQRGDLYTAEFVRQAPAAPLIRSELTGIESQEDWLSRLADGTLVLGPGLDRLRSPLAETCPRADAAAAWPNPARLLELAREAWASGRRDTPWFLEPQYLRRSAAEEQWDKRSKP